MTDFLATAANVEGTAAGMPEVVRVDYDLWTLRITLNFEDMPPGYLTFKDVSGVRILREGDLLDYWQSERPDGWLWEVQSGGWSALERSRNGFITGHSSGIREFLVAGLVDCVSVLTATAPEFSRIDP